MFFSVKQPLKILGKTYVPCVCYPVIKILEATVEHLEKQGKVYVYKEPVSFMNGKVLEKKKVKEEKNKEEKNKEEKNKKEKTHKPSFKEIVAEETNESVSSTDTF